MCIIFPPIGSGLYSRITIEELYQDLLLEVAQARVVGQVVITGDLTARTGTLPNCLDPTLAEHLDLPMDEEFDAFLYQAPVRQSLDTQVNAFGRHVLHLCQASGLQILNGRIPGDTPAQFTSHANAEHTVIDYFIASAHLCNKAFALRCKALYHLQTIALSC